MKCEMITCQHCRLDDFSYAYGYCQLENSKINEENTKCSNYKEIVIKKQLKEECKYCKSKNPKTLIGSKGFYISAWTKIYVNENDVRLGLNARGETDLSTSIPINYCPICGRKFNIKERR